jgi:predicted DNA-binding transcriptional regulator AlpA
MPSADALPPDALDRLLAAIKSAVAETIATPHLLDGAQARRYVGLSRSGWFRAASAGVLPKPVFIAGSGDRYRRADLDRFVERLRTRRKK